ncbi:hypothetical protein MHF_1375 [Mycoplasma haemofelis Ohio2]|uniref:Uncharacterized protein n=1 Tax=Mycoplasma haemofelis (strain Ohio2) TaxID=859194 RepID=F6FGH3_MYCHI|nr:hypothetical protein MHF_1375 [Mycoplasma haemofelis Ohio2]
MNLSLAIKIASGMGAIGAIGGGIALSTLLSSSNKYTLKNLVEKDKWTFLTEANSSEIGKILEVYKTKLALPFSKLSGGESNAPARLLEECKKLYDRDSRGLNKEDSLYKLKRWCVVPKTIQERLNDMGITLLSTQAPTSGGSESAEWEGKAKRHQENNKDKFTAISGSWNNGEGAKKIREHCETQMKIESFKDEFYSTLEKVKIWCSKDN